MFDITMDEPTREFHECWAAAGRYLDQQVDGGISSWLKAELTPPFLEHLSFRLGNQLFFVRVVDVDEELVIPGTINGLKSVSEGCVGHGCLMPMKKMKGNWNVVNPGWGLVSLDDGKAINPVDFVTDEKIIVTDWELHDFAVQVVRGHLKDQGFEIMSWQSNPEVQPAVWFVGENGPEWVVVKAARYPELTASVPENIDDIADGCLRLSDKGNFASVGFANSDDPFDPEAKSNENFIPIYRGYGSFVRFEGLQSI